MTHRGRPKGSKNKFPKGSRNRNPMNIFLRELPKEEQKNAVTLSELTGISLKKICGDAMAEGLAVLRTDVYAELVRFNERRGKVIHEKDLGKPGPGFLGSDPERTAKALKEDDKKFSSWEEKGQAAADMIKNALYNENEPTEQDDAETDPRRIGNGNASVLDGGSAYLGTGYSHDDGNQESQERSDDAPERSGRGSEIVKMSGGAEEESRGIEEDDL